jgi:hypothetical protein
MSIGYVATTFKPELNRALIKAVHASVDWWANITARTPFGLQTLFASIKHSVSLC